MAKKRKTAPRKVKPEVEVLNAPQEPEEEEEEHTLEPLDLLDDDALPAAAVLNLDEEKDAELAEPGFRRRRRDRGRIACALGSAPSLHCRKP